MNKNITAAINAALIGYVELRGDSRNLDLISKGGVDAATALDYKLEDEARSYLKSFTGQSVFGEEKGGDRSSDWILDKIDGVSLLPLIKEKTKKSMSFIFAESIEEHFKGNERVFFPGIRGKWRAMVEGDWKIIYIPHPKNDIFELYNLKDDPEEKNNLIGKEKEIASHMKNKILEFLKLQDNEGDANISDLTEKSKKLLRKLGYLD